MHLSVNEHALLPKLINNRKNLPFEGIYILYIYIYIYIYIRI